MLVKNQYKRADSNKLKNILNNLEGITGNAKVSHKVNV